MIIRNMSDLQSWYESFQLYQGVRPVSTVIGDINPLHYCSGSNHLYLPTGEFSGKIEKVS